LSSPSRNVVFLPKQKCPILWTGGHYWFLFSVRIEAFSPWV
jgi:hypothetical protein